MRTRDTEANLDGKLDEIALRENGQLPLEEVSAKKNEITEERHDTKSASESFSYLLRCVGGYGKWQWKMLFITAFCGNFTAFHNLGAVFLAYTPDHVCIVPGFENVSDISQELLYNISIPWVMQEDGRWEREKCEYYDRNYSQIIEVLNRQDVTVQSLSGDPVSIVDSFDDTDESLLPTTTKKCTSWVYDRSVFTETVVSEWDLVCQHTWLKSSAQSTYMGGILFGAVLISELSDKFGRRTLGVISAAAFFVSSLVTTFSNSYTIFLILRFLVATFSSGVFLSNFVNCMESVTLEGRTVIGIFYHGFFATGFCMLAGIAYLIRSWRYLQMAWSIPIVVLLSYYWIMPESPRWLMMQGRHTEAMEIMRDIAKTNGGTIPPKPELDVLLSRMVPEEKPKVSIAKRATSIIYSIAILLGTKNMRRRNLIVFFAWFVVSMVYYGLTFSSANIDASVFLTVGLGGMVEIPALFIFIWVINKLGRRGSLCLVLISTSISCLLILAVPKEMVWLNLTLNTIGKFFMSPAFNIVFLLSAELVPTNVRNIAVGMSSMFARIGSGIAPFIVDLLGNVHYAVPSTTFGAFALTAGLLSFLLPETGWLTLPESIEEVEGMPR